jgi:hypothetical protein
MASNKMGGADGDTDAAQQHNGGKGMGIFPPRIETLALRSKYFPQPTSCKAGSTKPRHKLGGCSILCSLAKATTHGTIRD